MITIQNDKFSETFSVPLIYRDLKDFSDYKTIASRLRLLADTIEEKQRPISYINLKTTNLGQIELSITTIKKLYEAFSEEELLEAETILAKEGKGGL